MPETMKAGSILIKEGALLPQSLQVESDPCLAGWRLAKKYDAAALDAAVREAGWTFFFLAGEIQATVFGINGEKMARRAVARILAQPRARQFNALEIAEIVSKRFLGIPYVCVVAESRHIQESLFLFSPERIKDAGRARFAAAPAQAWKLAPVKQFTSESPNDPAPAATTRNL